MRSLRSGEEEGALVTEQESEAVPEQEQGEETVVASEEQQPVAVPVSPSDKLTMYFQVPCSVLCLSLSYVSFKFLL